MTRDTSAGDLFTGPIQVMLTKAQDTIPRAADRRAPWSYEMKWDGFRAVLQVKPDGRVTYWSRNGSDLSAAFPDLVDAARDQVPPGVVLDGEAVAWIDGRLSFDHLQHRLVSRPTAAARLAREHPASYVAFDILAVDAADVRSLPWHHRRTLLEELATDFSPPLQISPYTTDHATAVQWFTDLAATGIEGIVAKETTSRYRPGERGWVKVKSRQQLDAVVGAIIGPLTRPEAIIAGRYTSDGTLTIVGRSTALTEQQSQQLAALLTAIPAAEHPWPLEISSGHFGGGYVAITHVRPDLVIEIAADPALQAGRHRHAVRLLRLRPDLSPTDIATDANG